MWDTQKGEPTNVKGSTQSWLGPFKVGMESVNDVSSNLVLQVFVTSLSY
jgi:hypothetical protein